VTAEPRPSIEIRPATPEDVPEIRRILAGHGNDGAIVIADVVGPYLAHLLAHHRSRVATVEGAVVAFAATVDTGHAVHLADLFVEPGRLGQGIGRPLLAEAFGDATVRTTFASDDERAMPLYVRAGMQPWWASLYVQGPVDRLPDAPGTVAEAASADALAVIERGWTGLDRSVDHAYWASMAHADAFVVRHDGAIAGIGYARARQAAPIRVLDRLVVHADADPVAVTFAALRRAARGGAVLATIQGPHPALRLLLERGMRIVDRDQYMASGPGLIDPARLVPNAGML
jgi:GNAT superfamily N-acetyltransferase